MVPASYIVSFLVSHLLIPIIDTFVNNDTVRNLPFIVTLTEDVSVKQA